MSSAILTAKPIKSWYVVVIEDEETTKPPQVQTNAVQYWVDTISKSPELLLTLQKVSQQASSDFVSQTGNIFKSLSNPNEAFLLQNPSFLYNKPVFQKPNPNIFSKLLSKIF
jgi:hypothetical protein